MFDRFDEFSRSPFEGADAVDPTDEIVLADADDLDDLPTQESLVDRAGLRALRETRVGGGVGRAGGDGRLGTPSAGAPASSSHCDHSGPSTTG